MMTSHDTRQATRERAQTLSDRLRELVAAIDARIPHVEREAERRIARDSGLLKTEAQERIAQLGTVFAGDPHRRAASDVGAAAASDACDLARMDSDKG